MAHNADGLALNDDSSQVESASDIHEFLASHVDALIGQLLEWIRVPSVAGSPERVPAVLRSANWLAAALQDIGFPTVRVVPTGDDTHAVLAEWLVDPAAPTVLIYSHHDVRAAKEELWDQTPPFEPAVRAGRLYGRGSSDAKGQVLEHLWGIRAHLATGRSAPAVNIKLLVEGEEELGSTHLAALLADEKDALACDLIIFSDTMMWRADHPAICTSMRGTLNAHLEVLGPLRDVHSGAVSGPAPNPVLAVSKLLAGLRDEQGRVAIPGFYNEVAEISAQRRTEIAALPYSDEDWLRRSETRSITGEHGYTVLERLWVRPAIEVTTIVAGDPVGPSRSAIPSMVSVDLSIRTVPDQKMEATADQIRNWVAAGLGDAVEYRLTIGTDTGQIAYETPDHPAVAALERAMQRGYRTQVIGRMGNAGGGPADLLTSTFNVPLVFFGTGLPEHHWHDSDEYVEVTTLLSGAATLGYFWSEIGSAF